MDPRVDQDHRALFKLLDRVSTHRRDSDLEDLNPLLDQLLEYSFEHFAREESSMEAWNYPRSAQHSEAHQAMRKAFIESLRQVVKGSLAIPVFLQHIKESFTYHFEMEDMLFICWQREHPNGKTPPPIPIPARSQPGGHLSEREGGSVR